MKKSGGIIFIVVLALLVAGGLWYYSGQQQGATDEVFTTQSVIINKSEMGNRGLEPGVLIEKTQDYEAYEHAIVTLGDTILEENNDGTISAITTQGSSTWDCQGSCSIKGSDYQRECSWHKYRNKADCLCNDPNVNSMDFDSNDCRVVKVSGKSAPTEKIFEELEIQDNKLSLDTNKFSIREINSSTVEIIPSNNENVAALSNKGNSYLECVGMCSDERFEQPCAISYREKQIECNCYFKGGTNTCKLQRVDFGSIKVGTEGESNSIGVSN